MALNLYVATGSQRRLSATEINFPCAATRTVHGGVADSGRRHTDALSRRVSDRPSVERCAECGVYIG